MPLAVKTAWPSGGDGLLIGTSRSAGRLEDAGVLSGREVRHLVAVDDRVRHR